MQSRLYDRTHDLLTNRPKELTLQTIAQDNSLSIEWLFKFRSHKLKKPDVYSVEKLYEYLAQKPLDLV